MSLNSIVSVMNDKLFVSNVLNTPIVHRDPFGIRWQIADAGREWLRIGERDGSTSGATQVLWYDVSTETVRRYTSGESNCDFTIYTMDGRSIGTSAAEGIVHIGSDVGSGVVLAVISSSSGIQSHVIPIAR